MSDTAPDTDQLEDTDAEPVEVLDPEDFNQSRRLKTIHDARDNVRDALEEATAGKAQPAEHTRSHKKLARAVATYGHELLPLMNKAGWEHEFNDEFPAPNVRAFIEAMGEKSLLAPEREGDYFPTFISMTVYGKLNQFMAKVGLGADLDDENDEWQV